MASSSTSTATITANANNKPSSSSAAAAAAAAAASQQDLHPLKCPRCDSANTKFCYYNNYSLSQPRHFCKACKRYWTRGGTLRNVPVGGGCRKNKRPKRHSAAGGDSLSSTSNPSSLPHSHIDLPPSSTTHLHHHHHHQNNNNNPLFYGGLSSNPLELNFPFSSSFRVSNSAENSAFDLNSLGLGFSSGLADTNGYKNGYKPIQDASSSPFSSSANNSNNSIFFGSSAFSTTASTMASLLASTHKFGAPGLMHYEDPDQMPGMGKQHQVKAEGENRLAGWNPNPNHNPSQSQSQSQSQNHNLSLNPMDQMNNNNSSDPSLLVWNTSGMNGWFDPSTMGSSVPSLI